MTAMKKPTKAQLAFMIAVAEKPDATYYVQWPQGAVGRMRSAIEDGGWMNWNETQRGYRLTNAGYEILLARCGHE